MLEDPPGITLPQADELKSLRERIAYLEAGIRYEPESGSWGDIGIVGRTDGRNLRQRTCAHGKFNFEPCTRCVRTHLRSVLDGTWETKK